MVGEYFWLLAAIYIMKKANKFILPTQRKFIEIRKDR
jgi:hypothetical protein